MYREVCCVYRWSIGRLMMVWHGGDGGGCNRRILIAVPWTCFRIIIRILMIDRFLFSSGDNGGGRTIGCRLYRWGIQVIIRWRNLVFVKGLLRIKRIVVGAAFAASVNGSRQWTIGLLTTISFHSSIHTTQTNTQSHFHCHALTVSLLDVLHASLLPPLLFCAACNLSFLHKSSLSCRRFCVLKVDKTKSH